VTYRENLQLYQQLQSISLCQLIFSILYVHLGQTLKVSLEIGYVVNIAKPKRKYLPSMRTLSTAVDCECQGVMGRRAKENTEVAFLGSLVPHKVSESSGS
jgi:hypothetical protein